MPILFLILQKLAAKADLSVLSVLLMIILSGCSAPVTHSLWQQHYEDISSSSVKPSKLLLNENQVRLCIQYSLTNASGSESIYIFTAKEGRNVNEKVLKDVFLNRSSFQVKSILLNGSHNMMVPAHMVDRLKVSLVGNIPDDNVIFEKEHDENGEKLKNEMVSLSITDVKSVQNIPNINFDPWLHEEGLIRKIVQHVWKNNFGDELGDQFYPILWVSQDGSKVTAPELYRKLYSQLVVTPEGFHPFLIINYTRGFVVEIKPIKREVKYITIMLPGNYMPLMTYHPHTSNAKPSNLVLSDDQFSIDFEMLPTGEGSTWPEYIDGLPFDKYSDCSMKDWREIPVKDISLNFNNIRNNPKYDRPLVLRVIGTPIALIADTVINIVMIPVVLYLFIFGRGYM